MSSLIDRISSDLQLKNEYIRSIVRRSNYYYKDYYISKKTVGSERFHKQVPN